MEEIESACLDSLNGIPSRRPIIEMTIPSALDKTISPPGTLKVSVIYLDEYIIYAIFISKDIFFQSRDFLTISTSNSMVCNFPFLNVK